MTAVMTQGTDPTAITHGYQMDLLWKTTKEQISGRKGKAIFLKNKKTRTFSWKMFVDSGKVAIFAAILYVKLKPNSYEERKKKVS